jgi:hypothetical protein
LRFGSAVGKRDYRKIIPTDKPLNFHPAAVFHHRQFLKFCGLDQASLQSGTLRGRTKLPSMETPAFRTFCMAAQVASRQRDNSFRDKLGRYMAGNANDADRRGKAMTAL